MNPLETAEIGHTNLLVSRLGFGGAPLGGLFTSVGDATAQDTVLAAYDAGLRYFDTAPLYGHGMGETRLGSVLRHYPRDDFTLSTKVGRVLVRPDAGGIQDHQYKDVLPLNPEFDFSADGIRRSFESSLERLGLDRIDIALIHDIDPFTHGSEAAAEARRREAMDGAYAALGELRRQGVVTATGIGATDWRMMEACAREADFDCFLLAMQYSLLRHDCLDSFLPLCHSRGIPVIVGAPFGSGLLARGSAGSGTYEYRTADEEMRGRVEAMEAVCASHGTSLLAAALRFPLGHPSVPAVLPGPRNAAHMEACVRALAERVPRALWRDLEQQGLIRPDAPVPTEEDGPDQKP